MPSDGNIRQVEYLMIHKIDAILTVRLFLVVDLHLRGDLQPWRRIRVRTGGLLNVAGHPGGLLWDFLIEIVT